jgi:hypothetical protein
MTALKILGIVCLGIVCLVPTIGLTTDLYQKHRPTTIGKSGKRELKINRTSYWDCLTLILPACLLLIAFLSSDYEEKATSIKLLGIGYMVLVLSPYNRRIDIPKINWFSAATCLLLAFLAFALRMNKGLANSIYLRGAETLCFPITAYLYLTLS